MQIQKKLLLAERDLTFKKAFAQSMQLANKEDFRDTSVSVDDTVNKVGRYQFRALDWGIRIQKKLLLAERDLTFKKAFAQSMQLANKEDFRDTSVSVDDTVNKVGRYQFRAFDWGIRSRELFSLWWEAFSVWVLGQVGTTLQVSQ